MIEDRLFIVTYMYQTLGLMAPVLGCCLIELFLLRIHVMKKLVLRRDVAELRNVACRHLKV